MRGRTYVASEDEVVHHAHDLPHGISQLGVAVARPGEVDCLSIVD